MGRNKSSCNTADRLFDASKVFFGKASASPKIEKQKKSNVLVASASSPKMASVLLCFDLLLASESILLCSRLVRLLIKPVVKPLQKPFQRGP